MRVSIFPQSTQSLDLTKQVLGTELVIVNSEHLSLNQKLMDPNPLLEIISESVNAVRAHVCQIVVFQLLLIKRIIDVGPG